MRDKEGVRKHKVIREHMIDMKKGQGRLKHKTTVCFCSKKNLKMAVLPIERILQFFAWKRLITYAKRIFE